MDSKAVLSQVINGGLPYDNIIENNAIVLIGMADFGPSMIPIKGINPDSVASVFGYESQLTNAYIETSQITSAPIYLIKINGTQASTVINDLITLVSLDASSASNDIAYKVSVDLEGVKTLQIYKQSTNYLRSYLLNTSLTIDQVARNINQDAYLDISPVYALPLVPNTTSDSLTELLEFETLYGGADELDLSQAQLYNRLGEVMNSLLFTPAKQVGVLCGKHHMQIDQATGYLYNIFSEFTQDKLERSQPCMVTIGYPTDVEASLMVPHLGSFNRVLIDPSSVPGCTVSEFVNFLAMRFTVSGTAESYVSNGVATYCGMIEDLDVGETTTNKTIPNMITNLIDLADSDINPLVNMGYVFAVSGSESTYKICSGVNLLWGTDGWYYNEGDLIALSKSPFLGLIRNSLIIQDLAFNIYDTLDAKIGEAVSIKEMQLELNDILKKYKNIIKEYSFSINEIIDGYTKVYEILVELVIYGDVNRISFAVSI